MSVFYDPQPAGTTTFTSRTRAEGGVPASFDAFLYKPFGPRVANQLKLTIRLRIRLRPLPPREVPVLDADGKPFWTLPWNDSAWERFIVEAKAQADMWNNRYWLLPPSTFSEFDVHYEGQLAGWRPNIRCELAVDFDAKDDAQRTIDVANLNLNLLVRRRPDAGTFRSHALLYDSLDVVPWAFPYGRGPDQPARHYVIAHEIGHAMGLGHIGTLLKTPLCELAIAAESAGVDTHRDVQGGRNSFHCYGSGQGIGIVGNVMGAGDSFTVENARPWVWAIQHLRQRPHESIQWRVAASDPGPGSWSPR